MKYLLILFCLLSDYGYLLFANKKRYLIALLSKTLASLCFLSLGYLGSHGRFSAYMLVGMAFDGLGDVFLGIRNLGYKKPMFMCGTLSFLIGHVFYLLAMLPFLGSKALYCAIASLGASLCLRGFIVKMAKGDKAYRMTGTIYVTMIVLIGVCSLTMCLLEYSLAHLVMCLGTLMFVTSDMILIVYNFGDRKEWMHPVYSALYYAGQILIALSLSL